MEADKADTNKTGSEREEASNLKNRKKHETVKSQT